MHLFTMTPIAAFLLTILGACDGIHLKALRAARRDMANAGECVHTILQCSTIYTPVTAHLFNGALFESAEELEKACRLNGDFIDCVERAKEFCEGQEIERVEVSMIKNRLWVRDLCAENSEWKTWYIKCAPCLNREFQKATGGCNMEYPAPPADAGITSICQYLDVLVACKSDILRQNCGETAADLYRRISLLNGGREYLCSENKEYLDEESPRLIAAQMLNNVRSLMKNISSIIRERINSEDAADILKEIDPKDPTLHNPFDMDTKEFVNMLKGAIPSDIVDMQKGLGDNLVKRFFDINDVFAEDNMGELPYEPEISSAFEVRMELPKLTEISDSFQPYPKKIDTLTESHKDNIDLTEAHSMLDDSSQLELSCRKFDGLQSPSYKSNASFNVYEISNCGGKNLIGSGQTMVRWNTFSSAPLDDLICSWLDTGSSSRPFRCSIKLSELKSPQTERKSPILPVLLALYTSRDTLEDTVFLSEISTLCVENFQPSDEFIGESESLTYPPMSTLQEYLHNQDVHRSGEIEESNLVLEEGTSELKLEGSYLMDGNSDQLDVKEIPQEESKNNLDFEKDASESTKENFYLEGSFSINGNTDLFYENVRGIASKEIPQEESAKNLVFEEDTSESQHEDFDIEDSYWVNDSDPFYESIRKLAAQKEIPQDNLDFDEATTSNLDFDEVTTSNLNFDEATTSNLNFDEATTSNLDFDEATISNLDFEDTTSSLNFDESTSKSAQDINLEGSYAIHVNRDTFYDSIRELASQEILQEEPKSNEEDNSEPTQEFHLEISYSININTDSFYESVRELISEEVLQDEGTSDSVFDEDAFKSTREDINLEGSYAIHVNRDPFYESIRELASQEILQDESTNNLVFEQDTSQSIQEEFNIEDSYWMNDSDPFYESIRKLAAKGIPPDESQNEIDVTLETNTISSSNEDYEIQEQNDIVDENPTLNDENYLKHPHFKPDLYHSTIFEDGSHKDSSEFLQPQTCQGESTSDCPGTSTSEVNLSMEESSEDCKQSVLGTSINPGVYIDSKDIDTIDQLNGMDTRRSEKYSRDENVDYIVVGYPYIPEDSPVGDAENSNDVSFITPSTQTTPVDMTQSTAKVILEGEIENIYAERADEGI